MVTALLLKLVSSVMCTFSFNIFFIVKELLFYFLAFCLTEKVTLFRLKSIGKTAATCRKKLPSEM